jgi:hypothetical protein
MTVAARFRGPAGSANGGYLCGLVAAQLGGAAVVTLHSPPPLASPLTVEPGADGSVRAQHGSTLVATAVPAQDGPAPGVPVIVSAAAARAAVGRARYFRDPLYPDCFVCGVDRQAGDGLRIFPGPVPHRAIWAAPWTPDASVADSSGQVYPEIIWAVLDCPGGIAAGEAADLDDSTAIVLGRMTAGLTRLPAVGEACRVIAWPGAHEGRKLRAGSALLGPTGDVLAVAGAVWLTVPRPAATVTGGGTR